MSDETKSSENIETENQDPKESENEEEEVLTQYVVSDPIDYTGYFENLQTIGILICALLVAHSIAFAFFKGFKK